jgi:hypothetical protein
MDAVEALKVSATILAITYQAKGRRFLQSQNGGAHFAAFARGFEREWNFRTWNDGSHFSS